MPVRSNACPECCEYCGVVVGRHTRWISSPGYRYGDGRAICAACHASAIKSAEQLRAVCVHVARVLGELGLAIDWDSLPVQMLDKPVLEREAGRSNVVGFAYSVTSAFLVRSRVSILYGMPAALAAQTVGHEAGHVWCREHDIGFDPAEYEEGFANVVAYLVLQRMPGDGARHAMSQLFADPDPVYGERFREQWARMQGMGWQPYREGLLNGNRARPWTRLLGRRANMAHLAGPSPKKICSSRH